MIYCGLVLAYTSIVSLTTPCLVLYIPAIPNHLKSPFSPNKAMFFLASLVFFKGSFYLQCPLRSKCSSSPSSTPSRLPLVLLLRPYTGIISKESPPWAWSIQLEGVHTPHCFRTVLVICLSIPLDCSSFRGDTKTLLSLFFWCLTHRLEHSRLSK